MISAEQIIENNKFETEILDLIENKDEFTQSDLQGAVGAIVMKIMEAGRVLQQNEDMPEEAKKAYPGIKFVTREEYLAPTK